MDRLNSATVAATTSRPASPRERILAALREAAGIWLSGEALSRELGISRAAVAKHVNVLRSQGNDIEAAPRRGYCLPPGAGVYTEANIFTGLATKLVGQRRRVWLAATDSTNLEAARQGIGGAEEGLVVVALHQQAGRAQRGHDWVSAPQSVAVSVLLRPAPSLCAVSLTHMGLEAAAGAIELACGMRPVCKAPNDLMLGGHKVGGVLVETGFRGQSMEWAVLGVGINVNARAVPLLDTRNTASSLSAECGRTVDRVLLLRALLERIDALYTAYPV